MSDKSLTGNELWDFICQPKASRTPALTKAEKRRRKKAQANAKAQEDFQALKTSLHEACQAMELWKPVARVYITYQVRCHCGAQHTQPELHLTDKPLVRLRHQRTKEEKTCRLSWEETPRGLPAEHRLLPASSTHCPECIDLKLQAPPAPPWEPTQLDLFKEYS